MLFLGAAPDSVQDTYAEQGFKYVSVMWKATALIPGPQNNIFIE